MAYKKKVKVIEKPKQEKKSIPCPVKGHNGMVEIIHTIGRDYAICHCPGETKHYGRVVWERIPRK